jgi:hypothetical protein
MPEWMRCPDASGWWFFCQDIKDWDLSKLVSVESIDHGSGVTFHRRVPYGSPKIETYEGWWYGPFRVEKPCGTAHDLDRIRATRT